MAQELAPLTDGLPTRWSKAIAVLTLTLTVFAYNVPSHIPEKWLPNSPEQIFLIRLLLSETILLLGSFVVIFLVVLEHKHLMSTHAGEIAALNEKHRSHVAQLCKPTPPQKKSERI